MCPAVALDDLDFVHAVNEIPLFPPYATLNSIFRFESPYAAFRFQFDHSQNRIEIKVGVWVDQHPIDCFPTVDPFLVGDGGCRFHVCLLETTSPSDLVNFFSTRTRLPWTIAVD